MKNRIKGERVLSSQPDQQKRPQCKNAQKMQKKKSKLYTNIQQDQKTKLEYHMSVLSAYMAGGEGVG